MHLSWIFEAKIDIIKCVFSLSKYTSKSEKKQRSNRGFGGEIGVNLTKHYFL